MNNRPLFGAVLCFTLGEVLCIMTSRGNQIGTAMVVLICFAYFWVRIARNKLLGVIYTIMLVGGFLRMWVSQEGYAGDELFGKGQYVREEVEYEYYSVSYMAEVLDNNQSSTNDGYLKCEVDVAGIGIIDDICQGKTGYNVTVKILESQTDAGSIVWEYKVIIYGVEEKYSIGKKVSFSGKINSFVPSGNPGEFNRQNYYKSRGIVGYSLGDSVDLTDSGTYWTVSLLERYWYVMKARLFLLRERMSDSLDDICKSEHKALYSGILLGDKGLISDEVILMYRLSGIAHIFAISGLHIGIVGGLLYKILRRIGLKFFGAGTVAMLVALLYGIMTGLSFSSMRAIIMLGLFLGGEVLGRKYDMLTGMAIALFVLLMVEPLRIYDGGLLLSFGAVAGVVVSKYLLKIFEGNKKFAKLKKKKYRYIYSLLSGFIFSATISLTTIPLISYMYFQIPIYSSLLNMLIVPLMSVTVFCGFLGMLVGCVSPFLGKIMIAPGNFTLMLYEWICGLDQKLPFRMINVGKPKIWEMVVYYFSFGIILMMINPKFVSKIREIIQKKRKKWVPYLWLKKVCGGISIFVVCVCVGLIVTARMLGSGERIVFLDVGQGDGTIIKTDNGTNIVIDVGSSSNDSLGEYVAYPGLLVETIGRVDYWIISHLDKDHISGLEYILQSELELGIVIDNLVVGYNYMELEESNLIDKAKEKGINIIYMREGDYLTDGSFVMKAIHPSAQFESDDKNQMSLVLTYKSDNFSALFTGDIGEEAILNILEKGGLEEVDILKVPHHGSRYSLSMRFLERINPDIAVISCGRKNSYGHPHKEVLYGLDKIECTVFATPKCGAVVIEKK